MYKKMKTKRIRILAQFALLGCVFFGCFSGFFPKEYHDTLRIVGAVTAIVFAMVFNLDHVNEGV